MTYYGILSMFLDWLIDSCFGSEGIVRMRGIPLHSFADSWIATHDLEVRTHSTIHSWKVADFKVKILLPGQPVKRGT